MPALTYFIYLFICLFFDNSIHEFILVTPTSHYPLSPHSHLPACFYLEIQAHKVASLALNSLCSLTRPVNLSVLPQPSKALGFPGLHSRAPLLCLFFLNHSDSDSPGPIGRVPGGVKGSRSSLQLPVCQGSQDLPLGHHGCQAG